MRLSFLFFPPSYNGILLPVKQPSGSNWQIYNHESSNHECCNDSERSEVTKYHCRFHRRRVPDGEVFTNTKRNTQENIKYSQTRCELHLGRHVTLEDGILEMAVHSASTAVRITSDRIVVMSGAMCRNFTSSICSFCVPASQDLQPTDYIARVEFCGQIKENHQL